MVTQHKIGIVHTRPSLFNSMQSLMFVQKTHQALFDQSLALIAFCKIYEKCVTDQPAALSMTLSETRALAAALVLAALAP